MLDPTQLPIKQKVEMGLWPNLGLAAHGVLPYLKKLKQESLVGTIANGAAGESAYVLLSEMEKLNLHILTASYDLANTNLNEVGANRIDIGGLGHWSSTPVVVDFLLIENTVEPTWHLRNLYSRVRPGGYVFVDHEGDQETIKNIKLFRTENKITTPVQMSKNFMWFWQKR